jgi:hypothetical protein
VGMRRSPNSRERCTRVALLFGTMSASAPTARAAARCGNALVLWTPPPLAGLHARTVSYRFDALDTTVELAQRFGEGMGVGGAQWPAGYVLAEWLSRRPVLALLHGEEEQQEQQPAFDWTDVRVCELGAGLGLVSIVVSLLGARVTATDGVEPVLPVLKLNMDAHTVGVRHPPEVELLAWGEVRHQQAQARVFNAIQHQRSVSPPHCSREDGLAHPADTSIPNLAAVLALDFLTMRLVGGTRGADETSGGGRDTGCRRGVRR